MPIIAYPGISSISDRQKYFIYTIYMRQEPIKTIVTGFNQPILLHENPPSPQLLNSHPEAEGNVRQAGSLSICNQ